MKLPVAGIWSRFSLGSKILVVFLVLSIASLAAIGTVALVNQRNLGKYALDSQALLGEQTVRDSTAALESLAEESLRRLAADQAAFSNALLQKIGSDVNLVAEYASSLWSGPERDGTDIGGIDYLLAPGATTTDDEIMLSGSLEEIFVPVLANEPNLTWIYIGTASGLFRLYPWTDGLPAEYDPRTRQWYLRAQGSGETGWTELYVDAGTGDLAVTCSRPVYDSKNSFIGVVAADVTLKTLNERIINTRVGEMGYAFLIDEGGRIIAHPALSLNGQQWDDAYVTENLLESGNEDMRSIAAAMVASEAGIARAELDTEVYVAYAPINCTGWSIGIVMPVEEIIAPALATGQQITVAIEEARNDIDAQLTKVQSVFAIIVAGIILLVVVLAVWLARTISRPILFLTEAVRNMGSGDLDGKVAVTSSDEVGMLAASFNKMAGDLKQYMAELGESTAQNARMKKEMEIGFDIQRTFLPESAPKVKGFEIAASNTPALEVGGDFYDFIALGPDRMGLVIADVSGKGVPAALFMAMSRTLMRANAMGNPTVSEAISRANNMIAEEDRANMFVTLFYGVLNLQEKTMTYVNAGHNPPMVLGDGEHDLVMLAARGMALGVMQDIPLEEKEIQLRKGDVLLLYTDGVTEAVNRENEQFGEERLSSILEENRTLAADDIIEIIKKEVDKFADGQAQFDDVTLMVVKVVA